jgi:L,D-peptidoglycan transpeptidase YkuD (ErfK/YbiS/YcfS/YnhG family)
MVLGELRTRRVAMLAGAITVLAGTLLGFAPATSAAAAISPVALGAEGTDGQLWVQAPQLGSGWYPLGGSLIAPPAVVAAASSTSSTPPDPVFVATGSNRELFIRSLTMGWQPLGSGADAASCIGGPTAVISGTTLTVACRGLDNALWVNSTTLPSSGLPQLAQPWTSLGGVLSAGPAASIVNYAGSQMVTFFVSGTTGQIFMRTLSSAYSPMPWFCFGSPAAAFEPVSGTAIFACAGTDHQLWTADNTGAAWNQAQPLGGQLIGGPAIAATSGQSPEFLAEGQDHSAWMHTSSGWTRLGGSIVGGIGAAILPLPPATGPQGQLITVTASYGSTYATLTAYDITGAGWVQQFGPWTARVGYNGIAAPGTKREGDGKTPSGAYAFSFFFGVLPNPGVSFPYRNVYSYDYWDDDPLSPLYNEWVDTRTQNPGISPEPMDNVPAYNYGAVIAYNTARTPGLGSGIFLHVDTGGSTAGCVSLPQSELVTVLTWLNPADNPAIQITGV